MLFFFPRPVNIHWCRTCVTLSASKRHGCILYSYRNTCIQRGHESPISIPKLRIYSNYLKQMNSLTKQNFCFTRVQSASHEKSISSFNRYLVSSVCISFSCFKIISISCFKWCIVSYFNRYLVSYSIQYIDSCEFKPCINNLSFKLQILWPDKTVFSLLFQNTPCLACLRIFK